MKRKDTTLRGCVGYSSMLERSVEGERSSKKHDIRIRV
jgi:hypothetical protein